MSRSIGRKLKLESAIARKYEIKELRKRLNAEKKIADFFISQTAGYGMNPEMVERTSSNQGISLDSEVEILSDSRPITIRLYQAWSIGNQQMHSIGSHLILRYHLPIDRTDLAFLKEAIKRSGFQKYKTR